MEFFKHTSKQPEFADFWFEDPIITRIIVNPEVSRYPAIFMLCRCREDAPPFLIGLEFTQMNWLLMEIFSNALRMKTASALGEILSKRQPWGDFPLKPGGKALILEFSKPLDVLQPAYDFYSFNVLPKLGRLVADDEASYRYLAESIRMHPDQETLLAMMEAAGFERCRFHNLAGGIVALHVGWHI